MSGYCVKIVPVGEFCAAMLDPRFLRTSLLTGVIGPVVVMTLEPPEGFARAQLRLAAQALSLFGTEVAAAFKSGQPTVARVRKAYRILPRRPDGMPKA